MFFSISNFASIVFCKFKEVEHIVLKQALSINIIFHMKHTKFQYSHSFSDTLWSEDDSFHILERWKINIVMIKCIPPGTYPFPEFIHIFTHKEKMTDIICLITVWTYRGVFDFQIKQRFVAVYDSVNNFILEWL